MGSKQTRKNIINKLRGAVKQATIEDNEIDRKKLIAYMALENFMTERTIKELVQTFINAGEFIEEYGTIRYDRRRINADT